METSIVNCSAGFFFFDEMIATWYILGMSVNFDEVMLPTVTWRKGKIETYQSLVALFQKFGLHQLNPFTEVYKKIPEREGGPYTFCYLANDLLGNFSEEPSNLEVAKGIQVIELAHEYFQFRFWKINDFEKHLLNREQRVQFTALVNKMKTDPKFSKDNIELITNLNSHKIL